MAATLLRGKGQETPNPEDFRPSATRTTGVGALLIPSHSRVITFPCALGVNCSFRRVDCLATSQSPPPSSLSYCVATRAWSAVLGRTRLLLDDHPAQPYGTFRDPAAAVMLSIIFGNSLALGVQRRWDRVGKSYFSLALLFKVFGQILFYVAGGDTEVLDLAFLLLAHALIAVAASGGLRSAGVTLHGGASNFEAPLAFIRALAGIFAVTMALVILRPFLDYPDHNQRIKSEYYTFAAARAFIPYLFWTTMKAYYGVVGRSTSKHGARICFNVSA